MRAGRTTRTTRPSIGGVHNQILDPRPPTRIERALGHQRAASSVLLVLLPLVCWSWIVVMARDMYGPMTGASAWMMTPQWDAPHLLLLWAMWAVMMTGMMLPSAAPMILLAGDGARSYFLAFGYLVVWSAFSAGATALQWLLQQWFILTPMMEVSGARTGAFLLALA